MAPRPLSLLGATGVLGELAFDLAVRHPDRLRVVALAAGRRWERLAEQIEAAMGIWGDPPPRLAVSDQADAERLRARLHDSAGLRPDVGAGVGGLVELAAHREAGLVVCTLAGMAAWEPAAAALEAGHPLVLASKEVLAAGGAEWGTLARGRGVRLQVLDSELLAAERLIGCAAAVSPDRRQVRRLTITASGGPFREVAAPDLAVVTPAQAVRHPVWTMGPKISVDSATLINKSLEVVVAHGLFGLPPEALEVVIHPQAILHAMVSLADGSHIGLMSPPDMRLPLARLLGVRAEPASGELDLARLGRLRFEPPDLARFPGVALGHAAIARGPLGPAALVGADETAVSAFMQGRLPFPGIAAVVSRVLKEMDLAGGATLEDRRAAVIQARRSAEAMI